MKRWGILETSLNGYCLERVVGDGTTHFTPFKDAFGNSAVAYKVNYYIFGEEAVQTNQGLLKCVLVSSSINNSLAPKHYLFPIPVSQISLNKELLQNPIALDEMLISAVK